MDLDYLKKLAGIGETPVQPMMSLEQEHFRFHIELLSPEK